MTTLPFKFTLRALCTLLLCLLVGATAAAQTCTTATTSVSGTFSGGGFGSAPLSQTLTATGTVSGSNLVVSVQYDLTPTSSGTITQLDVVFGPGFTSTVQTSTTANNISYSFGTGSQVDYSPPSFIRLSTTALGGGTVRAQGTITIPIGSNQVINGKLVLRPMINGNFSSGAGAARFSVSNNTFSLPTDGNDSNGVCVTGFCQSITSFSASPAAVSSGQSTTLSWTTLNATSVDVIDLATGLTIASGQPANGSLVVTPASSRTYRIVANGSCAAPTSDAPVTVCPSAAASSFSASPSTINAGGNSTLSWNVPAASSVTIAGVGTFGPSGSVAVTPSSTTTYTLTASGDAGCAPVTLQTTVTVNVAPTISTLGASPSTICAGASSTLSWTSSGGASATITDLLSGSVTSVPVNGSLVVTPSSTRTYRLTVTNGAGSVTQDVSVTVNPLAVINGFSASPTTINVGQSTTLTFSVSNTTSRSITDLSTGSVTTLGTESGTATFSPTSSRTYRLTASNGCNSVTQDVTITVANCQAISNFSASVSTINAGQSTTLSYTLSGATSATITDLTSGAVTSVPVQTGSLVVTPATTRTYRLTVSGPCAALTQDLTITVNQPPSITALSASPSNICAGSSSTLSWSSTGGASASITDLTAGTVTPVPVNGSLVVTPASTRTYRLTITNGAGSVTQDVSVTVAPLTVINSYSASATTVNVGQSSTLTYSLSNATTASITDLTSGSVTSVPVQSGSLAVTPASTRTYRLTVTNGCNSVTQDVTITVVQTPTITSLTASPSTICAGANSTLAWSSSGGNSATITDLTAGTVTSVPVTGSLVVTPPTSRTYRLTVTNAAGSTTLDVPVTVNQLAVVNTFSASATTINFGQSTTLTFSVSNTTSRSITDLSTGTVTNLGVESGTQAFSPATTRTYRLTATSGCNSVTRDITITVNQPPVISTLSASPSTICAGASSTLSWTSSGGASATITDLVSGSVTSVPVNGSLAVTPATTRAYRLTVTNGAGSVTQDVTVTVNPAASISSFTANPALTTTIQGSTLDWTASGTSATITNLSTGTVTNVAVTGTLFVQPPATTTYRLTVTNACGSATSDVTVTIVANPTIASFTASPTPICRGASSTLSWTAAGGTRAYITGPGLPGSPVTVNQSGGTLVVTPTTTTTYTLTVVNDNNPDTDTNFATRSVTVTVSGVCTGNVLLGPQGQPAAVGPTNNNDDYSNRTLTVGVAVPTGGVTTAGGTFTFTNTVRNNAASTDSIQLSILSTAPGVASAQISVDGGSTFAATQTISLAAATDRDVLVRVTLSAGITVLTGYDVVVRATSVTLGSSTNNTIDRLWTGFISAVKSQAISNSTGIGSATDAVSGAVITYTVTYTNVTATSGANNVNLTATNVILTEDGNAAPNNWATTTNHVPASATDSRGGVITGDVAGSSLLTDTIPSLAPGQSGTFQFKRVIR